MIVTDSVIASGEEYDIIPGIQYQLTEEVAAKLRKATPALIASFGDIEVPDTPESLIDIDDKDPEKDAKLAERKGFTRQRFTAVIERARLVLDGVPDTLDFNTDVDFNMSARIHTDFLLMSLGKGGRQTRLPAESSAE